MIATRPYPDTWVRRLVLNGLTTAIVGSSVPIPLYPIYRAELGLDAFTMTVIFVVYVAAVLTALFCLPPILSRLRNPYQLFVPAVAVVAAGAVTMSQAHDLSSLILGRVLGGLGTGSATLAANILLIELSPGRDVRRAANSSTLAFGLGSAVGPLLSGAALQLDVWPTVAPFLLIAISALLSLHAAAQRWNASAFAPAAEHGATVRAQADPASKAARLPWGPFLLCAGIVFTSWGLGASMMALGPLTASEVLGITDYALSGYAIAAFMLGSTASLWLHRRTPLRRGLIRGCLIVGSGMAACCLGVVMGSVGFVLAGMLLAAAGHGGAFGCAAGLVQVIAPPPLRPRMISLFYIAGYVGNLLPLLTGGIADHAGIDIAVAGYLLATALAMFGIALAGRRILPDRAPGAHA